MFSSIIVSVIHYHYHYSFQILHYMIGLICGGISVVQLAFADKQERNLYKGINHFFIYLYIFYKF